MCKSNKTHNAKTKFSRLQIWENVENSDHKILNYGFEKRIWADLAFWLVNPHGESEYLWYNNSKSKK